MATIALVTCGKLPALSDEDQAVRVALEADGHTVHAPIWNDPAVDWRMYDAVVIRTTWDYHYQPDMFRAWLERLEQISAPLWNPAPLVRWNMDKRYLLDLAARGIPIVPTVCLDQGEATELPEVLAAQGWDDAVIKPRISATAWQTWRASRASAEADQARFREQLAQGGLLVQPFMDAIRTAGEWSLIFLHGAFSHAVRKTPQAGDFRVQRDFGGQISDEVPWADLLAQASNVVAAIPPPWLYARVDGVVERGVLRLMELELIEPELYLTRQPMAVARLVAGVMERLAAQHHL